jgi:predicted nucleic acid-binding protein
MRIHEYYYNEDSRRLYVEFSTRKDGDRFYRVLELDYEDIELYSPDIIIEEDLIEVISEYLKSNDLPDEIVL